MHEFEGVQGEKMDFEGETIDQRNARRKARWTPAVLVELKATA